MKNVQDYSKCLSKLERCYKTLQHVKAKMNSYMYEPSTSALFETKEYLKSKIDVLTEANESLLQYLQRTKELFPEQFTVVNYHIQETFELEDDVTEYTLKSRMTNI